MTFMQIGLPVVVFDPRKAGLSAGGWRDGACFLTFQAIVFGEAEHR
jgi:hypothetical protein